MQYSLKVSVAEPIIAIALKSFFPSLIALNIAVLSAQLVNENDEFSILHPKNISLSFVKSAAPTLNFEYGLYEFFGRV